MENLIKVSLKSNIALGENYSTNIEKVIAVSLENILLLLGIKSLKYLRERFLIA